MEMGFWVCAEVYRSGAVTIIVREVGEGGHRGLKNPPSWVSRP